MFRKAVFCNGVNYGIKYLSDARWTNWHVSCWLVGGILEACLFPVSTTIDFCRTGLSV